MTDHHGWRPIATVPRDGTSVLLWDRSVGVVTARYSGAEWVHDWTGEPIPGQRDLTYWHPLPPPPEPDDG